MASDQKSGKFIVRMEPKLHGRLVRDADKAGVSLNTFVVGLLASGVGFTRSARKR